jgi:hypothetical protein
LADSQDPIDNRLPIHMGRKQATIRVIQERPFPAVAGLHHVMDGIWTLQAENMGHAGKPVPSRPPCQPKICQKTVPRHYQRNSAVRLMGSIFIRVISRFGIGMVIPINWPLPSDLPDGHGTGRRKWGVPTALRSRDFEQEDAEDAESREEKPSSPVLSPGLIVLRGQSDVTFRK